MQRFNAYRIMWLFVLFDLPVLTKADMRRANRFRTDLIKDGFSRFQLSVYTRHCSSMENLVAHKERIKKFVPEKGLICALPLTDRQFSEIEIFCGKKRTPPPSPPQQLELF